MESEVIRMPKALDDVLSVEFDFENLDRQELYGKIRNICARASREIMDYVERQVGDKVHITNWHCGLSPEILQLRISSATRDLAVSRQTAPILWEQIQNTKAIDGFLFQMTVKPKLIVAAGRVWPTYMHWNTLPCELATGERVVVQVETHEFAAIIPIVDRRPDLGLSFGSRLIDMVECIEKQAMNPQRLL